MFEDEEWKDVEKLHRYMISSYGRVMNREKDKLLTPSINDRGFPIITLYGNDKVTRNLKQINRLVAAAFLPPPFDDRDNSVWHIDGDLSNCHISNLKWEMRRRVLEWNDMHRRGTPLLITPKVRNNRTGIVFDNAFECALYEGDLEDSIVLKVEKGSPRYSYVYD